MRDVTPARWRTSRLNPRAIHVQRGDDPADADTFIGVLDGGYARRAVEAVNAEMERDELIAALNRLIVCRVYADPDDATGHARSLLDRLADGARR